jgi:hypothetical protein
MSARSVGPATPVRLQGVGPVGFVRVAAPISLADLRIHIRQQLAERLPETGFSFLVGGITLSLTQEENEDYQEGDVFIVAQPFVGESAKPPPIRPPSASLVQQFADAFGFMCAASASVLPRRSMRRSALIGSQAPLLGPSADQLLATHT